MDSLGSKNPLQWKEVASVTDVGFSELNKHVRQTFHLSASILHILHVSGEPLFNHDFCSTSILDPLADFSVLQLYVFVLLANSERSGEKKKRKDK